VSSQYDAAGRRTQLTGAQPAREHRAVDENTGALGGRLNGHQRDNISRGRACWRTDLALFLLTA
jgi:hypothetical protein